MVLDSSTFFSIDLDVINDPLCFLLGESVLFIFSVFLVSRLSNRHLRVYKIVFLMRRHPPSAI